MWFLGWPSYGSVRISTEKVTVNRQRYRLIIINFLRLKFEEIDLGNIRFLLLNYFAKGLELRLFQEIVIINGLQPIVYYFLRGYLKSLVFRNKSDFFQTLQVNIECVINYIRHR